MKKLTLEDLKEMTSSELDQAFRYHMECFLDSQFNKKEVPDNCIDNLKLITDRRGHLVNSDGNPTQKFKEIVSPLMKRMESDKTKIVH